MSTLTHVSHGSIRDLKISEYVNYKDFPLLTVGAR